MANELTITKEQTAKFVHDAVEMETAVFTLDRAIQACEEKKNGIISQAKQKKQEANEKILAYQRQINAVKQETYQGSSKAVFSLRWYLANIFLTIIIGFIPVAIPIDIVLGIVEAFLSLTGNPFLITVANSISVLITLIILIGIGVLICKLRVKIHNSKYEEACLQFEKEKQCVLEQLKHNLAIAETNLINENSNSLIVLNQASLLTTQIADLRAKRNQVQSTLSRFYDLGVIPPDYRYMDCAIMLDQIFRNDLADTMRDAIKIYEERVFRGEVIKGMDRICSMLGNLSVGMMAIEQRLSSIDSNVKMMSQDLYNFSERIAQGQAKQQKATEELLKETEMSRYATEQLAQSTKNLEWFERRRQGWV